MVNQNILLISGKSATGKTASLRNIQNHEGVLYLNCEANKALTFPNKFKTFTVTNPNQIYKAFEEAEKIQSHTIVIDSLTFLMDMFESLNIIPVADGRAAWGRYAQYYKNLMQQYVAKSTKNVIIFAHTSDIYNESEMVLESMVKVKGSLMNQGIESYFNTVLSTKKITLKKLEDYNNKLLTITEDEELVGYKHVFQTRLTKDTVNERIRSPLSLWGREETFINNDIQLVIERLTNYYNVGNTII